MKTKVYTISYLLILTVLIIAITGSCKKVDTKPKGETVTDIDGNVYQTVTIGTQVWMAENLRTTRYRDSMAIPNVSNDITWNNLTTGAYCDLENESMNSDTYGKLYNWYAVHSVHKLSMEGWHVPTDEDWQILSDYLGGDSIAGGKLKETGVSHWKSPNTGATNESKFNARPGGYRGVNGTFTDMKVYGNWWSATDENSALAWGRYLYYDNSIFGRGHGKKSFGFSIRCVKD